MKRGRKTAAYDLDPLALLCPIPSYFVFSTSRLSSTMSTSWE